jgi:hypothetical protein
MSEPISRRLLLGSAVSGAIAAQVAMPPGATAAQADSAAPKLGKAKPTWNGFEGVALCVLAADDFSPVEGVEVSLTFIGSSWAENSTSAKVTDKHGQVTFNLTSDRPGPYLVGLRPPKGSRFCASHFDTPETMLTIQPDGRYFPQVFRIGFHETKWKEMTDHLRAKDSLR